MAETKPLSEDEVALENEGIVPLVAAAVATGKVVGAGKVVGTIVLGLALGAIVVASYKLTLEFLANIFC